MTTMELVKMMGDTKYKMAKPEQLQEILKKKLYSHFVETYMILMIMF